LAELRYLFNIAGCRLSSSDSAPYHPHLFTTLIMDTPAVPAPRDTREQAVLEKLVVIRDQLLLLKLDRSTYIRSQDVIPLYDRTIEQVKELNIIRAETGNKEENRRASAPTVPA
jgi:hypothetical protein